MWTSKVPLLFNPILCREACCFSPLFLFGVFFSGLSSWNKLSVYRAGILEPKTNPVSRGFPGGSGVKNLPAKPEIPRRRGLDPWVRKIPWRKKWEPAPVFLPGKSHGQRSLVGYSPWGHKTVGHNVDTKQRWSFKILLSTMDGEECSFPALLSEWGRTGKTDGVNLSPVAFLSRMHSTLQSRKLFFKKNNGSIWLLGWNFQHLKNKMVYILCSDL